GRRRVDGRSVRVVPRRANRPETGAAQCGEFGWPRTRGWASVGVMASIWEGERVRLRGIEPGDWEAFMRFEQWSDDVRAGGQSLLPRSAERYRQWAAEQAAKAPQAGADEFELAIESLAEECLVGGSARASATGWRGRSATGWGSAGRTSGAATPARR